MPSITLHAMVCLTRYLRGRLAAPEARRLGEGLRVGDVVVDVGAHCGSWMLPIARRLPTGRVYAIEALPHYAAVLGRVKSWLGLSNVTIVNGAATDRVLSLPLVWKDSAGRRLTGLTHVAGIGESTAGTVVVQGRPLDEWIPREDWGRVRLIKCDIEGAELAAFRGAEGILKTARPAVFCEINDAFCRRYGHGPAEVFAFFAARRYVAFVPRPDRWESIQADQYGGRGDVLFVPPGDGLART